MYIMNLLGNVYRDARLLHSRRHIALLQWSCKWPRSFYNIDLEVFLALGTPDQGVTAKLSAISNPSTGLGFLPYAQLV